MLDIVSKFREWRESVIPRSLMMALVEVEEARRRIVFKKFECLNGAPVTTFVSDPTENRLTDACKAVRAVWEAMTELNLDVPTWIDAPQWEEP